MRKNKFLSPSLVVLLFLLVGIKSKAQNIYHDTWIDFNKNGSKDIFEDPNNTVEDRVADLLSQMNVNEKTCQMVTLYGYSRVLEDELPTEEWKSRVWKDGIANIDEHLNTIQGRPSTYTEYAYPFNNHAKAINIVQKWFIEETRLGIPVDFTNEGVHGLCHKKATPLPAPINIGSTWNRELVYKAGQMVAREAKILGYTNIYAPILDLARDPRWGRVLECYGEEPYHIGELGTEMARGIESQGVASTLKHFAVYSVPKGARDGDARTDPHVAPREMHQMYLYPFKKVIRDAKPMGVMSSYNDYDGVPVTGSHYFLTELLKDEFGFKGYVVSDSEAVEYLSNKHNVAEDYKEAVRQVVEAGLNVRTTFRTPESFVEPLRELIHEGKLSMKVVDERVAEVLAVKFRMGLFDSPYNNEDESINALIHTDEDEALSRQLTKESMVLLKNENKTLPLNIKKTKKVLVTGPLADEVSFMYSRYGPAENVATSVYQGIKNYGEGKFQVNYEKGCDVQDEFWPKSELFEMPLTKAEQRGIDAAVAKAQQSDVVIAVLGEDESVVGESKSRTSLGLPGRQLQLLKALHATGKPVVLVLINGQPLTINWANEYIPSILEAWFPCVSAGDAVADILFGDYNPGGKLSVTFPKSVGQIPYNFPSKPGAQAGQKSNDGNGYGSTRVVGALYPFGYGLSYTSFEYSKLTIDSALAYTQSDVKITFDVTNTGDYEGDEIVQLYIQDVASSVTTYESQLRGFERLTLKPKETKTVSFTLHPEDLELLDKDMNWTVEPGEFKVKVGASSIDIRLKGSFTMIN